MCGIAGILNLNNSQINLADLKKFTDSIAHRGPDGAGYELLENETVGLGHRRLSILDLSEAGKQPMFNPDKDLCVSFNGEIYNFIEIRNELKGKGFTFHTETDTEVILAAYKLWGKECLNKFNGMFVIAIWDEKEKELFIARDRFGVKPLYYLFLQGTIFAFCSETIGFKNLNGFQRAINPEHLNLSFYDPALLEGSDKTIFKSIYQLQPGHFLTIKKNSELKAVRWWSTKDNLKKVTANYNEQVEEFRNLFESACKLRLRSDVPIASALSGGLDSSSVYATLHKINSQSTSIERQPKNWQQAFVATFPGTTVDEKRFAEKVIDHVGGKATYIVPDYSKLADEVIQTSKLFDGVIFTPINAISSVYKSMRDNDIVVSMDGHGVDEMMYGYNTYVYKAFFYALEYRDFALANDLANTLCGLSPNYNKENFISLINAERNKSVVRRMASKIKNRILPVAKKPERYQQSWTPLPNKELVSGILSKQVSLNDPFPSENLLYEDFHYLDMPLNLRDFDRASMQNGIEIRMPFMDYRLVSYVFSLPMNSKIGGGYTKRILRDAMKSTLPEEIRTRTLKIGIGGPDEWYTNELKPLILDITSSSDFLQSQYWNGQLVKSKIEEGYRNNTLNKSDFNQMWALISTYFLNTK